MTDANQDQGVPASPSGCQPTASAAEGASSRSGIPNAGFWPFRITDYAPSHRQFRLDGDLPIEQVTEAVGCEPKFRPDGDKVTVQWQFYAELTYELPDGGFGTTSTCCKIWDYDGERWSAYGWPEVFEQIGLTPLLTKDYGDWHFRESGNPTLALLASAIEAQRAATENTGAVHESAVPQADAQGPSS